MKPGTGRPVRIARHHHWTLLAARRSDSYVNFSEVSPISRTLLASLGVELILCIFVFFSYSCFESHFMFSEDPTGLTQAA